MGVDSSRETQDSIQAELTDLIQNLPDLKHGRWIHQALRSLLTISQENLERLDWKIAVVISGIAIFSALHLTRVSPFLYFQF